MCDAETFWSNWWWYSLTLTCKQSHIVLSICSFLYNLQLIHYHLFLDITRENANGSIQNASRCGYIGNFKQPLQFTNCTEAKQSLCSFQTGQSVSQHTYISVKVWSECFDWFSGFSPYTYYTCKRGH